MTLTPVSENIIVASICISTLMLLATILMWFYHIQRRKTEAFERRTYKEERKCLEIKRDMFTEKLKRGKL